MKRFFLKILLVIIAIVSVYFLFTYFAVYSEGDRSGDLVKFSKKGVIFKTWEGKLSQGVSEELQFEFSVEDKDKKVINDLQDLQGKYVKLHYIERYRTFFWLGETKYFIKKVEETQRSK
ncbi:6-phosphogluconate dehydrogenase [Aestuariivivens insulae]|uniref:6-phosphogluconate dehydrogenase n=1 Tax=Aestuariivivens insulae TaxID=1621988 RepID=UPI001F586CA4|nr:6-phosphogluconate dehydrogenase [Aestuariivivens insulae]